MTAYVAPLAADGGTSAGAASVPAPAGHPTAGPVAGAGPALGGNWVLFRQNDHGYLLSGEAIQSVAGMEQLQPLRRPVEGWAGTLPVPGGALPVLDGGVLLGHGGALREIVVLQVPGVAPFGLAVGQLAGIQRLPAGALAPISGAPGLAGGMVLGAEVVLALNGQFLGRLRRAAVGLDDNRRPVPLPVTWRGAAEPPPSVLAHPPAGVGEPLLVLAEGCASEPERQAALPLRAAPTVAPIGALRPGPPGPSIVEGYGTWNQQVLAAVRLSSCPGIARGEAASHAVLLTDPNGTAQLALTVAAPRGVQWLTELGAPPPGAAEGLQALGRTAQGAVAIWDPTWIGQQLGG